MKRFVIPFVLLCVAFACACVFLLQPLRLVSGSSTRLTVHLGKTVELVGIAELAGGYRCYVNEDEYFWLSSSDCVQEVGSPLRVTFHINDPATIYRGET